MIRIVAAITSTIFFLTITNSVFATPVHGQAMQASAEVAQAAAADAALASSPFRHLPVEELRSLIVDLLLEDDAFAFALSCGGQILPNLPRSEKK